MLYYTEKFVVLYRIIRYSVNEFAYNEGLISRDVGFVISRGGLYCFKVLLEWVDDLGQWDMVEFGLQQELQMS